MTRRRTRLKYGTGIALVVLILIAAWSLISSRNHSKLPSVPTRAANPPSARTTSTSPRAQEVPAGTAAKKNSDPEIPITGQLMAPVSPTTVSISDLPDLPTPKADLNNAKRQNAHD